MANVAVERGRRKSCPLPGVTVKAGIFGLAYAILFLSPWDVPMVLIGVAFAIGLLTHVTRWRRIATPLAMAVSSGIAICAIHYWNGTLEIGLRAGLRLNISIWGALLFAALISATEILDALEDIVRKAGAHGRRFRVLPLQAAMVIRFAPLFADRARAMRDARIARGARGWSVDLAAPLVISALRESDLLAEAIRSRGFAPWEAGE